MERRRTQICKSYVLKIDKSHLSATTREPLRRLFLEAKWFYNHILAQGDLWNASYKIRRVLVKVKDGSTEERELKYLSSQMRQEIIGRARDNIRSLSRLKQNGYRVGSLKFVARIASIPLNQYSRTYRIVGSARISIQKLKVPLRVRGLEQVPKSAELANAMLIQRNGDYYIHVTTWQPRPEKEVFRFKSIGMDIGMARQLTFSNRVAVKFEVPVTKKIRRLHRELSKRKPRGKNWFKTKVRLDKAYHECNAQKRDIRNKIVSKITGTYDAICIQKDNVSGWQRMWGRRIQSTALGGITSALEQKAHTPVEVDRFYPSTKKCSLCGAMNSIGLQERLYECDDCSSVIDRDLNAAIIIWNQGLPAERRELTPVDTRASTELVKYLNGIPRVHASLVEEAGSPRLGRAVVHFSSSLTL